MPIVYVSQKRGERCPSCGVRLDAGEWAWSCGCGRHGGGYKPDAEDRARADGLAHQLSHDKPFGVVAAPVEDANDDVLCETCGDPADEHCGPQGTAVAACVGCEARAETDTEWEAAAHEFKPVGVVAEPTEEAGDAG